MSEKLTAEKMNYMYQKYIEESSIKYMENSLKNMEKISKEIKKDKQMIVPAYEDISKNLITKKFNDLSKIEKLINKKESYEEFYNDIYDNSESSDFEKEGYEYDYEDDFEKDFSSEYYENLKSNSKTKSKPKINSVQETIKMVEETGFNWSSPEVRKSAYIKFEKQYSDNFDSEKTKPSKLSSINEFYEPPAPKLPFEKSKFLQANLFMKIGHYLGMSLRNKYYNDLDKEVKVALSSNEVYRVLEAQKNGYFLGKNLNKLTLEALYKQLTTKPMALINELISRDVMLSMDNLSLVLLSPEGKELITGQNPESYPNAKQMFEGLLSKENFLHANKNLWLQSIKDKEGFLKEDNPLFYHEKMLNICEKNELLGVKKELEKFLQHEDVLKSISKNKLIDKMLLKLNMQLGHSIELEHMITDLPKVAQKLFESIKEIKFSEEDIKILESAHKFEYDLIDKKIPEAVMKYLSVDSQYRDNLKNISGKTAENLLVETLENILITKKDLSLTLNQYKLSELSVTRRYTDTIRGDIGKPSIVTLKTLQQLKESGELSDLAHETILEKKNTESKGLQVNYETINETIDETIVKKFATTKSNDIMRTKKIKI